MLAWEEGYDIDIISYKLRTVPQAQIKEAIITFLNGEEYDPLQGKKNEICMWLLDKGYLKENPGRSSHPFIIGEGNGRERKNNLRKIFISLYPESFGWTAKMLNC